MLDLNAKKVVVVGGSSGIGYAAAKLAKSAGAEVVIASREGDRLRKAADALGVGAVAADVTDDEAVKRLFEQTGIVDHVAVTAAVLKPGHIKRTPIADARATMESKFWGAWRVAHFAEIAPGGSLTLVTGFLQHKTSAELGHCRRGQRRA